jgi:predicted nucleic acid-binding protein
MPMFADTSGLYAALDARDAYHPLARDAWERFRSQQEPLITSNYIVVELIALINRRLGVGAARIIERDFLPVLQIVWADEAAHGRAMAALLTANSRNLSLVDCVSFVLMRDLGLDSVFTFDAHFREQGFRCVP